jgi:hypothetical protein
MPVNKGSWLLRLVSALALERIVGDRYEPLTGSSSHRFLIFLLPSFNSGALK